MFRSAPTSPCHFFVDTIDHDWNVYPHQANSPYLTIGTEDWECQVRSRHRTLADVNRRPIDLTAQSCDANQRTFTHRTVDIGQKDALSSN